MNKTELVVTVQNRLDISKVEADRLVNAVLESVREGIKNDKSVQLIGFGTFSVVERKERTGINPQTKEPIQIDASKVVKFKPGKMLKDIVNKN